MNARPYIKQLLKESGWSAYRLGKALGFKSNTYGWLLATGKRHPSVDTCYRLIELAKLYNINLTLDMLLRRPDKKVDED